MSERDLETRPTQPLGFTTFSGAATAYDRHIGRYGPALAQAFCDRAEVAGSQRALDVGSGPGALTGELVGRLGPRQVTAVEPSPTFAAACQARWPETAVLRAAAEALPLVDDAFDRTLAQLVVNFLDDAVLGVREMARVTRPGGRVAAAVWDYGGEMTLLRTFWSSALALDPSAAEHDEGRTMRFATPGELHDLWVAGSLLEVDVRPVTVSAHYSGHQDLWDPLESGVAPSGAYVARLSPAQRTALRTELLSRLGVDDAPFQLTARAWIVVGRVPRAGALG
jgi:SAM-dependent methyltransferase